MEILRMSGRVVVQPTDPDRPAGYAGFLVYPGEVGGTFELNFDVDGDTVTGIPLDIPLEVKEGLHAAILRALTSSPEVFVDVTSIR